MDGWGFRSIGRRLAEVYSALAAMTAPTSELFGNLASADCSAGAGLSSLKAVCHGPRLLAEALC